MAERIVVRGVWEANQIRAHRVLERNGIEMHNMQERAVDVARRAADLIEREGWVQGEYHEDGGGYCLVGAVRTVLHDVCPDDDDIIDLQREILWGVKQIVSPRGSTWSIVGEMINWNDANGRTKDQVVHVLRQVGNG